MRGKIAVAVIVVLACALFLVPYASAEVEITCSVYPEEADFKSEFVYNITLTNFSFMAIGNLSLKVGSDSDNRSISGEWNVTEKELEPGSSCVIENKKIRIPEGGSCTVKKGVNFTHPELNQGAFRDWTENPKSPEWDGAWYECCFKPLPYGDEVCCEGSGKPILTHCIEKFREHHVEQNETYNDLSFDYYIKVWANCKDRIELQVRNYSNTSSSKWDKHVLKNYTELDVYTNKSLTWHAVNLTRDNFDTKGRGQYKFVGYTNKSQLYSGPTIEERFDDPKVSYKKTINELLSFDYEVSVWVDLVIDSIKLEVYNFTLRDWEQKGIRNYTTPGKSQKLIWTSININCDQFDGNPLSGKYRFVGSYKRSSNITGPVIEEKFYTLDVTPKEGTNTDTFNYSVTVNANICDKIMLQVKNHTTNLWNTKGTRDYTTPSINETLIWHNIKLNTHELNRFNDSMFRFKGNCGTNSSEEGLRLPIWPINPIFRNLSVKQDRGFYSDNFNYNIDVKAKKNGTVKLSIFCPDGSLLCEPEQDYNKAPQWQTLNWSANFSGCDVKTGDARYRFGFWYKRNETINRTEEGPYIWIAKFGNETVEPELGTDKTQFNYTINVTAAQVGTVELLTKCPEGTQWATRGEIEYDTPKERKTLKWTRIELPCDNCGNAEYMFRFIQGNDTSEIYTGPMITTDEFGKLLVSPGNGSEETEFNFSVNFSSCIEEELTLQVWNSSSEVWENVSTEHYMPPDIATITFSKICCPENLVPQWSDERVIKWRVTSSISNCNTTSTYWDIGLKWYNSRFYPEEGEWNEPVAFFVNLSANRNGSVELQIKLDGSKNDSWNPIGEREVYNRPDPQMVNWSGKSICKEPYEGNTSYRFVFFWHNLSYRPFFPQDQGPKLFIPINISITSNVSPNDGICYIENSALQEHFKNMDISPFTYSINVSAEKNTSIKLVTINPLGEETEYGARRYYAPGLKTLNWTVESTNFERIGRWNYTFSYYDTGWSRWKDYREEKFEGPEPIAILKNFTIDPKPPLLYGESCNVTVVVNGSRDLNITLELCSSTASCTLVKRKMYNSSEGEREMVWKDIKPFGETYGSTDKLLFYLNVT